MEEKVKQILLDSKVERLLLRPSEAAEALGIGRTTVYEMVKTGDLPSIQIGGRIRIPVSRLRAFIESQQAKV